MSDDYKLKVQDIESDFYSALGKFYNIDKLYLNYKNYFEINEYDDDVTIKIKKSQKNELLVDLGRVGELAFKYIIKLEQLNAYPNQTFEQFQKEAIFKLKPMKTFAVSKKHIEETEIKDIIAYKDLNNQPFHNFDYLFLLIEKLMKEIAEKFYKIIEYSLFSKLITNSSVLTEEFGEEYIIFPGLIDYIESKEDDEVKKQKIRELRRKTIKETGDIFTRLRYFANNPFDKEFDFNEIYELMKDVIIFIKIIHNNGNSFDFDPIISYGKLMALENSNIVGRQKDEIIEIFSNSKIKEDALLLSSFLFYSDYDIKEIREILNDNRISSDDYIDILTNGLHIPIIKYFFDRGIYNVFDMREILLKGNIFHNFAKDMLAGMFNNYNYLLEELKIIEKEIENDKYNNLILLKYLPKDIIKELNNYRDLQFFLIENVELLSRFYGTEYRFNKENFKKILFMKEICEDCCFEALYAMDIAQLKIYTDLSVGCYSMGMSNHVNFSNFDWDEILQHIKDNIILFGQNKKMFEVIPVMLDSKDNLEILNLLIKNGLDINNLKKIDSTIFCIPVKLLFQVVNTLKKEGEKVIVENNINDRFYDVLKDILDHHKINKKINSYYKNMRGDSIVLKKRFSFEDLGKNLSKKRN